jgi:hypothetical protein
MADQFDLEQGIMTCWNVTSELDLLLEELMENHNFNTDKASNFVLGLSTIYEAKFEKLFRDFEDFLKSYYAISNELKQTRQELRSLRNEMEEVEEANNELSLVEVQKTLDQLLDEEELYLEDEFGLM